MYDLEQGRLQAEENRLARIQAEEQKSWDNTKGWLTFIGIMLAVGFLDFLFGSSRSSNNTNSSSDLVRRPSIDDEPKRELRSWEKEDRLLSDYEMKDPQSGMGSQ